MYTPKSGLKTFQPKKPGKPDYGMMASAARMGAESAPIVPTTNTRVTTMNAQNAPNPNYNVSVGYDATQPVPSAKDRMKDRLAEKASAAKDALNAERDAPVNAAVEASKGALQQSQADMQARLGAAGFGTSGARAALSGNLQARAARELAAEINNIQLRQNADRRADRALDQQIEAQDRQFEFDVAQRQAELDSAAILNGAFIDRDGDGFQDNQPAGTNLTEEQWNAQWAFKNPTGNRQHYGDLNWGAGIDAAGNENGGKFNPYLLFADEDPRALGLTYAGEGPNNYKMWVDNSTSPPTYYISDPR